MGGRRARRAVHGDERAGVSTTTAPRCRPRALPRSPTSSSVTSGDAPRTAGLALALVILGGGVTVLAIGASRGERVVVQHKYAAEPEPVPDLPLALGFALLA